jgi:hypothetical protein
VSVEFKNYILLTNSSNSYVRFRVPTAVGMKVKVMWMYRRVVSLE